MKKLLLMAGTLLMFFTSYCQETKKPLETLMKNGIKIDHSKDGKNFTKIGMGLQMWARYGEYNEKSTNKFGESQDGEFNISLRRTYISSYTRLNRISVFGMIGIGTQTKYIATTTSKNAEFFLYDLWGSYNIWKGHMSVGMGLHMFSGLSRYTCASSALSLGADVPYVAVPNLAKGSQAARQLGFFATGKFGIFDYKLSINQPFESNTIRTIPGTEIIRPNIAYEYPNRKLNYKGYFTLQLWDKESFEMPFKSSTYLGKKKVFNIGLGFDYTNDGSIVYNTKIKEGLKQYPKGTYSLTDKLHLAADVFIDMPLPKGDAITFYTSIFKLNYGKNYYLNYDALKNDKENKIFGEPRQGTGYASNTQIAYMFANKSNTKYQVYYIFNYKNYEALDDKVYSHKMGWNIFLAGHKAKLTFEYQLRPYFKEGEAKTSEIGYEFDKRIEFDSFKNMFTFKLSFKI